MSVIGISRRTARWGRGVCPEPLCATAETFSTISAATVASAPCTLRIIPRTPELEEAARARRTNPAWNHSANRRRVSARLLQYVERTPEDAAVSQRPNEALSERPASFQTHVPARLDRLPWCGFHWLVLIALGVTWILDGLEVTLSGAVSGVLQDPAVMNFSATEIGAIASAYLTGAVLGSLLFGYLTDRFGRKKMFFLTLSVYLLGTLLTAFSWDAVSFALFRFITGAGIGGEYAAINSAIDELIPAKYRGRADLIVNGSYWIGAALGSASTLIILNPAILPPAL